MEFDLTRAGTGLLVLDLQELFTSAEGPFRNTAAGELIARVNELTEFCAGLEMPVICSRYLFRDDLADAGLLADNPVVAQGGFCESSPWMALDARLEVQDAWIHLQRNRPGAFWNGALEATLDGQGIDTLVLCGLSINNAISTTAREAFARDIPAVVARECSGTAPGETEMDCYFDILHTWTAEVAHVEDIMRRLEKA